MRRAPGPNGQPSPSEGDALSNCATGARTMRLGGFYRVFPHRSRSLQKRTAILLVSADVNVRWERRRRADLPDRTPYFKSDGRLFGRVKYSQRVLLLHDRWRRLGFGARVRLFPDDTEHDDRAAQNDGDFRHHGRRPRCRLELPPCPGVPAFLRQSVHLGFLRLIGSKF